MKIEHIAEGIVAFVRTEEGANVGLVRTRSGAVVIDTTSSAADMRALLEAVDLSPADVRLVINTHSHSDHTWGNQLFDCPILAHQACRDAMEQNIGGAWDIDAIRAAIAERGRSEPQWAAEMRAKIQGLRVTLPTETFDHRRDLEIGGVRLEVIYVDAHTPGSAVVWLPGPRVLYAGDLLFVGRYPFIGDADIPELIEALGRLPEYGAQAIVPGHGPLCGEQEIEGLRSYLHGTWSLTVEHLAQGHTVEEACRDPAYPRYAEKAAERYHETNICVMYDQLVGGGACAL